VADIDLFQDDPAESEDQDFCGNLSECASDPDVNSIDRSVDSEVPEVPVRVPVIAVEPGGDAALQLFYLQGFMGMDE
jgi:hypothetical protein